jgi:nucleoside-diphosphate-sugar epimerase
MSKPRPRRREDHGSPCVLVTGGAGYVGSVVARRLLAQGYRVRALDCLLYSGSSLLGLYHHDGFHFVNGDVRSSETVAQALEGVETVVHLAAIVGDPACARRPDLARAVNLDASLQLIDLSRRSGVKRFIFASTCSNYGKMADPRQLVTEESELHPVSLYAETKVDVEKALLAAPPRDGPTITVLRLATVFGVSPRMRFDLTVNQFTMELLTKRRLVVYGEQFWRPYVHVRDVAEAVAMVVEAEPDGVRGVVFNVGDTQENFQKGTLVDMIRSQVGGNADIERVSQAEDPRDYRVSFEKIKDALGFRALRTVAHGIREIISVITQRVITDVDNPAYRN